MGTDQKFLVAVAQINTVLGDFAGNRNKILETLQKAKSQKCDLVVFPESTIFGYHPFDLLERSQLVDLQLKELKKIEKAIPEGVAALVGVITKNPQKKGRPYFNSAALIQKGKASKFFHKELLPTGDVFDEARFIGSGSMANNFFNLKGKKIFVTICEDIWAWPNEKGSSQYQRNPLTEIKKQKIDLILNLSASPFYFNKIKMRKRLVQQTAKALKAPMIYANLVGAQDEIIFDGASFALDSKGKLILQCKAFEEDFGILELPDCKGKIHRLAEKPAAVMRQALVLGIRDFCQKVGINRIHLGLSGGVDSALVACLAVDAIGTKNVEAFGLPTDFNLDESLRLAEKLAKNLQIRFQSIPIQKLFEQSKSLIDQAFQINQFSTVHENLQARIRGMILMAFSNRADSLLLATSNKTEMASGYSTLYGDMCGALAPIADLTKGQVYEICDLYNFDSEIIPKLILTRAPSAELKPNQKDQDSLPPYPDLDQSVNRLVRDCKSNSSETDRWLSQALMKSEFKRWQAPPILKVSEHAFGRGRRYPIAKKMNEI